MADVVKMKEIEKQKEVLKAIVKTQEEKFPDLEQMRLQRNAQEAKERKELQKKLEKEKAEIDEKKKEEEMKWKNSVNQYNDYDNMKGNKDADFNPEDDFL
jgi:hypothetical protein